MSGSNTKLTAPISVSRRRVLVQLTSAADTIVSRFYGEHMAQSERLYARYSAAQLELLLGFVREGREFNEREAELLEQRNRARASGA